MSAPPRIDVGAVDHVYVAVSDLARSEAFYDAVMRLLGFKKGTVPIGGEPHVHYFNRATQYTIRPARSRAPHDPYGPGLHHLCFRVDEATELLEIARRSGGGAWPDTLTSLDGAGPDGQAVRTVYLTDPDGVRIECISGMPDLSTMG